MKDDLCRSYSRVKYIESHKKFCDSNGFLSQSLSREFNSDNHPDYLHLNYAGLKLLSVSIKNAIFNSKRREGVISAVEVVEVVGKVVVVSSNQTKPLQRLWIAPPIGEGEVVPITVGVAEEVAVDVPDGWGDS